VNASNAARYLLFFSSKDVDKNTRKFACFAVGNAGFHNDKLYEHLRPVVPMLVELLKDPEVKCGF
jgi:fused-like protein